MTTPWNRYATLGRSVARSSDEINRDLRGGGQIETLADVYRDLKRFYFNDQFGSAYSALGYLYRTTKPLYNPTRRVVDWYKYKIYDGPWTSDGLPLPDGTPSAIPFASDTEETVRLAAMAAMEWGNWDERRSWFVHLGAMCGDVLVKGQLDVEAGKAYPQVIDPEHVTELQFNQRGDVIMCRIEVPQRMNDARKTPYTYGEIITKETITTLKDGKPYSYDDVPAEQPNPFGFCPVVWVNHSYVGGVHGACAIEGTIAKITELNELTTPAHEYIQKLNKQPIGVASDKPWRTKANDDGIHFVNATAADTSGRPSIGTFKGPADLRVFPLLQDMGLAPSLEYIRNLIAEIEKDLPETVMDQQLREMDNVAGVAIPRLMGDVANRFSHAQRSYDRGLVTIMQMLISMGAFAVRSGLWGRSLTEAQRRFGQFDLTSYDRGELGISLMPRPLIRETPQERAELALLRSQLPAQATVLREAGYSDEDIYGDATGAVPERREGILTERQAGTASMSDLLGSAFNAGRL